MTTVIYMQRIPAHYKLQSTENIMKELEYLMNIKSPTLVPDQSRIFMSTSVLSIIYEVVHAIKDAKECNRIGKCYKNTQGYNVAPAMIKCSTCGKNLCISCGNHHAIDGHCISYITHSKLIHWMCEENSDFFSEARLSRKSYPECDEIIIEEPEIKENLYIFNIKKIQIPAIRNENYLFYTEILFEKCESENIIIFLRGTGIVYNNSCCLIQKHEKNECSAPKIGWSDTIGIGITLDCKAFFTYNGYIIGKYIDFSSEYVEVTIEITSFLKPSLSGNSPCLYNEAAFKYLEKGSLLNYKNIIRKLALLGQMKDKVFKSKIPGRENLFAVIDDVNQIVSKSEVNGAVKYFKYSEGRG